MIQRGFSAPFVFNSLAVNFFRLRGLTSYVAACSAKLINISFSSEQSFLRRMKAKQADINSGLPAVVCLMLKPF